jgi:hypothetical protein
MGEKKYYFYRMTADTGNAPCVFEKGYQKPTPELLTLACCKGGYFRKNEKAVHAGLRQTIGKEMNDNKNCTYYIIGIYKDRILYIAKIDKAILMIEYFSNEEYGNRMDCIYEVKENSKENDDWKLKRRKDFNSLFHGDDIRQHYKDELGGYVLLSEEFSYFGKKVVSIPDEIQEFIPKRQETKTYSSDCQKIKEFVEEYIKKESYFNPTEKLTNKCAKKGCQK